MKSIFVQIASYRDPQLIPTIKDCLENAKNPKNLVFSIAWQHAEEDLWDNLDEFLNERSAPPAFCLSPLQSACTWAVLAGDFDCDRRLSCL